jgi:TrmH family RNA methyltransferase
VRTERRLFLADGPKAVQAALEVEGCVVEVFATVEATERYAAWPGSAPAWAVVDDSALASLSDSVTPAGVVAVCRFVDVPVSSLFLEEGREPVTRPSLVAICADVRDPGNAGTVIRTADAAGADAVVLAGTSVDAYNPKTVRASVGSLFHVPFAVEPDVPAAVAAARAAGLTVLAADGAGEVDLDHAGDLLARRTAWLFGNEAWGLPAEVAALADHRLRIPIHGRAESLNLSTAAALCLYASASAQRR